MVAMRVDPDHPPTSGILRFMKQTVYVETPLSVRLKN